MWKMYTGQKRLPALCLGESGNYGLEATLLTDNSEVPDRTTIIRRMSAFSLSFFSDFMTSIRESL